MSKSIHIRIRAAFKTNFLGFGSDHPPPTPTPYGPPHHKISVFWRVHIYKKITLINAQKLYLLILKWLSLFVQHGGHTRLFTLAVNLIHTQVFITLSKLLSLLPMVFASLQAQNYPLDGADNWDQTGFKLLNIVPLLWSWISLDQLYHLSDPTTTPYFQKTGFLLLCHKIICSGVM